MTDLTAIAAALEAMRDGETTDLETLCRQAMACIPDDDAPPIMTGVVGNEARVRGALERFQGLFQWALDDPDALLAMDPDDALRQLVAARDALEQDNAALAVLQAVTGEGSGAWVTLERSGADRGKPAPEAILWRDDPDSTFQRDPVVSAGEVAVLAGAGGGGKSWLCIRLAVEADRAAGAGDSSGAACGLRIAPRPVVILSYEMSRKRIDQIADTMGSPDGVFAFANPVPVFTIDVRTRTHGPSPAWRATWDAIAAASPALVVIDTGPKAMGGIEPNAAEPVIAFMQAVERELRQLDKPAAALVLAHDTKAMRDAARAGEDMGAGAVAGSGQWHDCPRGVLHLSRVAGTDIRILEALKCSLGRENWGARLCPLYAMPEGTMRGSYAGLQLDPHGGRIAPGGMMAARRAAQADAIEDMPDGPHTSDGRARRAAPIAIDPGDTD